MIFTELQRKPGFIRRSSKGPWLEDLTGHVFGRWTITHFDESRTDKVYWFCRCECGNTKSIIVSELRRGHSTSCGCYAVQRRVEGGFANAKPTHKLSKTPEYAAWVSIKKRCYNTNDKCYKDYGGRGITVADEWVNSFEQFLADMGAKPDELFSIDRIDVNGPYAPGNCRWSTSGEQANNKRDNTLLTLKGVTLTMAQWAEQLGINYKTLRSRKRLGWDDERALTTPQLGRSGWRKANE